MITCTYFISTQQQNGNNIKKQEDKKKRWKKYVEPMNEKNK